MNDIIENYERPEWYSGYIVTLNTLARFFSDTREDVEKYCGEIQRLAEDGDKEFGQHPHTYLAFGDFDRITFNGVNRFSRFFDLDKRSKYWLGKHQNVYLYQIKPNDEDHENNGPRLYPYKKEENMKGKKPYFNDFGFCINYENEEWKLFSSNYGFNAEYNNVNAQTEDSFFPFFIFSQISLSNDILSMVKDREKFLIQLRREIISRLDPIIDKYCCKIRYEIYGCLNTSELSILWITEQYTDVLFLIDELKKLKYQIKEKEGLLFFSSYSVIGRLMSNSSTIYKDYVKKCNGTAQIDIIVNNTCSANDLIVELREQIKRELDKEEEKKKDKEKEQELLLLLEAIKDSCVRVGEHDISLKVPASLAYDLFNEHGNTPDEKGIFKRPDIRENILGTRVAFLDANTNRNSEISFSPVRFDMPIVSDKEIIIEQFIKLSYELDPNLDMESEEDAIRPLYLWIRNALKGHFSSHTGAVDTLDMLYTDYLSNIHESYNAVWRNDYNYQFKNSLRLLKLQLEKIERASEKSKESKETEIRKIEFWELYPDIIDNIRQQTAHFSQSGRLVMRIPSSHLRYTACCDLMFHGYYGMVKAILADAYSKQPEYALQSELLPVITTNSNTNIRSKLFFVGPNCYDLRLLHIDIPYSLLYDPVIAFPYMVHEMFHYIAPASRAVRNEAIGCMVINEVLTEQYINQFYECLKLYYYEQQNNQNVDDDKYRELVFSAQFIREFNKSITNYNEKISDEITIPHNVIEELENSLRIVLWKNDDLKRIREEIIQSVANETDQNSTWTDFQQCLLKEISQFSLPLYEIISENLLQSMYRKEHKSDDDEDENFIGCSDALNRYLKPGKAKHISYYEKKIYDHKTTVLNPNNVCRANIDSSVFFKVKDILITGLREASPDMAMAMYCEMDDISYLVSYARQVDSSISKINAGYDIVRISVVLAWIYYKKNRANIADDKLSFECFDFYNSDEKRNRFITEYMVEYLHQDPKEDKLVDLVTEAFCWFWRFKYIVNTFWNKYYIYSKCIADYGSCYEMYYANQHEEGSAIKQLVESAKSRREQKIHIRKELLSSEQWNAIREIDQTINGMINPYAMPNKVDIHKEVEKKIKGLKFKDSYDKENTEYNQKSFATSLSFIHQSARQMSLEKLGEKVNKKGRSISELSPSRTNEESQSVTSIDRLIDESTVRRAWGMTEFTSILQSIRKNFKSQNSLLWYLAITEEESLIPSVLSQENANSRIYTPVNSDSTDYSEQREELYKQELIQMMTEDNVKQDNKWKSSMIYWHKDLLACLKRLVSQENRINLYLFSPNTYLKARNFILRRQEVNVEEGLLFANVPSILRTSIETQAESIDKKYSYYLLGEETEDKIQSLETTSTSTKVEDYLKYDLPVPLVYSKRGKNSNYLAYNLALPQKKGEFSEEKNSTALQYAVYTVDQIQRMMLYCIRNIYNTEHAYDKSFDIKDWAFLYTIRIDRDIVNGINDLNK